MTCIININVYCLKFHKLCLDSMINTQVKIIEHVCVGVNWGGFKLLKMGNKKNNCENVIDKEALTLALWDGCKKKGQGKMLHL